MIPLKLLRDRHAIARPLAFFLCLAAAASAHEIDIAGPPGSGNFGWALAVLPNGNIVVGDPLASSGAGANAGAVYLYSSDGTLISALRGSSPDDRVGDGPIFVLPNGNFVVTTGRWDNGGAADAGAVTWIDGTTGLDGVISAENSLVGTSAGDQVGFALIVLANGSYVVSSPNWSNGEAEQAGAATWVPADGSVRGAVSAANSLVGAQPHDRVGDQVLALTNGNYLVASPRWANGALFAAGAVTWASGTAGITGLVSVQNSLVGGSEGDSIGSALAYAFPDGNAVVGSPGWHNGTLQNAGAVTWIDGSHGITGLISQANSLVGAADNDFVGSVGIEAYTLLPGGRYAIISSGWSNENGDHVGAVTWADTAAPITGPITRANSLVGSTNTDFDVARVIPLANGNWVVSTRNWSNGSASRAGAVTWIDGAHPLTGPITPENSLVGTEVGESVGWWVAPLTNGNYIVASPGWNNGSVEGAGAVTWVDGSSPRSGTVTAENSLVGTHRGDLVGMGQGAFGSGSLIPLTNGNYVVLSYSWSTDAAEDVGAITWGNGATGVTGPIGPQNSLIGETTNDGIDLSATPLVNGNVVISRPNGFFRTGAVTWMDGSIGLAGTVSRENSLVGRTIGDAVTSVTPVANGNYFVFGSHWSYDDSTSEAGAVVWGDGRAPLVGEVSSEKALIGTHSLERIGFSVRAVGNDSAVITSEYSVTLARSHARLSGPPNADSSVLALQPGMGIPIYGYDATRDRLVVGWYNANYVAIFQTEALLQNGFD
jgi:hypothetical protein